MGAAHTTSACGEQKPTVTEGESQTQWRRNQISCSMVQLLSTDRDAQYQCYQPYLLLVDIIHLHHTCRIWAHWIRSPGSVLHRSLGHLRNRGCVVTLRNSNELVRLTRSHWLLDYLYGCRISPPVDERSNSWVSDSIFNRWKSTPPLLTQLAELKQIQHLTLDYVHPKEITIERIQTYFTALAPSLRSLELFPLKRSPIHKIIRYGVFYSTDPAGTYTNNFLAQIHLLANLEELRVSAYYYIALFLNLTQLLHLARFHTFICTNVPPHEFEAYHEEDAPTYSLSILANCKQLKHCSWNRFLSAQDVKDFVLTRQKSRTSNVLSSDSLDGDEMDPMEFLDLSEIRMEHDLWTMIVANFPKLKSLHARWQLPPQDWSSLRAFKKLTHLCIKSQYGTHPIEIDHFWNDLIQCRTIESLTLGSMKSLMSESRMRTLLSHLSALTDLTLSNMRLENVAGFSEPNQLRRLAFKECGCPFNIRVTLPSIPSLTHLTLYEDVGTHLKLTSLEQVTYTSQLFARMPLLTKEKFVEATFQRDRTRPHVIMADLMDLMHPVERDAN